MGLRPSSQNCNNTVQKYIGTGYDTVKKVADNIDDVTLVAESVGDLNTTSDNIDSIVEVSNDISSVIEVADKMDSVTNVGTNITEVINTGSNIPDITTVSGSINNINNVSSNIQEIGTVAENINDVNIIAGNVGNLNEIVDLDIPALTVEVLASKDDAENAANRAEAAADVATINAKIFDTVALGEAGTVNGDYFSVVSPTAENYLDLYKNESGSAAYQKSYPSTQAIDKIIIDLGVNPDFDTVTDAGNYKYTISYGSNFFRYGTLVVSNFSAHTYGQPITQYFYEDIITYREFNDDSGWTDRVPYTQKSIDYGGNKFIEAETGWNIVDPKTRRLIDNSAFVTTGLLVEGVTPVFAFIPIESGVEYISKTGSIPRIWTYDSAFQPIRYIRNVTTVTFNAGEKYIAINETDLVIKFGKNVPADYDEPYSQKVPLKDVRNIDKITDVETITADLSDPISVYDSGVIDNVNDAQIQKIGDADYSVTASVVLDNTHKSTEDIRLISVNNETIDVVKVELLNRTFSRGFGVPTVNTELKITTEVFTESYNVSDINNHLAGDDMFTIRRVDPSHSSYEYELNGVYDEATDLANYTLPEQDLGWVLEITATSLELVRYDYTLVNDELTIGTTPQETISVPFNPNEKLDDFVKRLSPLVGDYFEVYHATQDINVLCTDLIPCEIQMCQWIKPLKYNQRRALVPAHTHNTYIVDATACILQAVNKKPIEITLTHYTSGGYDYHEFFVDDFMVFKDKRNYDHSYSGEQFININKVGISDLQKIKFNLNDRYVPVPILNLTGHSFIDLPEYESRSQAVAENPYKLTTGRTRSVMSLLKENGYKQISIQDFLDMSAGIKEWEKSYFWTIDDTASIESSNDTEVHRKLRDMGVNVTAGINTISYKDNAEDYSAPSIAKIDTDFFVSYAELFNHGHIHSSHYVATGLQMHYNLNEYEKVTKENAISPTRLFALPFNEGDYRTTRYIRTKGYPIVTAFFGGSVGAIFKGTHKCRSPRVDVQDQVFWEFVGINTNKVGLTGYDL